MSAASVRENRLLVRAFVVVSAIAALMTFVVPAVDAKRVGGATLAFIQQPTSSSAAEIISPAVQVAAKNSRGQINTRFKGLITLTLQGAGTLYGTVSKAAVEGVATFSNLAVDPAGTYTLVATDGNSLSSATSAEFAITGLAVDCTNLETCFGTTGNLANPTPEDSIIGSLRVSTTDCTAGTCFLTVDEEPASFCNGPCLGNAFKFITPSNATGIAEVQWGCDKSLCPGTGVTNFTLFLEKADLNVVELVDCSNPAPDVDELPCIQNRSRTGVGDLLVIVWLTPDGDPRMGGG